MTGVDGPDAELIQVGRIGPARGVRGDVFVQPFTDTPAERFVAGARLLTDPADAGPLTVASSSSAGGKLVVHFEGVEDRPAVEALRGTRLLIARADRPAIEDPDEFYDTDLVGLSARGIDGTDYGAVTDVVHAAGATYLVLQVEGQERLVPFVSAIVPTVDLAGASLTIDPPDGLFDL
jgi:16S rRNA processing protein RimM